MFSSISFPLTYCFRGIPQILTCCVFIFNQFKIVSPVPFDFFNRWMIDARQISTDISHIFLLISNLIPLWSDSILYVRGPQRPAGTGPRPVRNRDRTAGGERRASEWSFTCHSHHSHHLLSHLPSPHSSVHGKTVFHETGPRCFIWPEYF